MRLSVRAWTFVVCAAAWGASADRSLGQTLTHLKPIGFLAGQKTRITLYGSGLAGVRQIWTSIPAETSWARDATVSDNEVSFDVTFPADTPVGMYGVRAVGDAGISDVRLIVIDDLPPQYENGTNDSAEKAQPLPVPSAVDGFLPPEQSDFYSIEIAAGQQLSFEIVGHRLGNGLDPLLRIVGPDGKEFVEHDNDEGLGYDFRFETVFPIAGKYTLELRDTRYQGGAWGYHLRIGDFPVARVAFPAGGQRGRWLAAAFPGRAPTDVPPASLFFPPEDSWPVRQVSVPGATSSGWVHVAVDDAESQVELEPNDDVSQANPFVAGRTLEGRLQKQGDVDAYRFHGRTGGVLFVRGETRRLGSPADLLVRLMDEKGQQLQAVDDQGAHEGEFQFSLPADGDYTLWVEDLNRRGGFDFVYRIETHIPRLDAAVKPATDRLLVARGSRVPLSLAVERDGWAGELRVDAKLSGEGVQARPAQIPPGQGGTIVMFDASPTAPMGTSFLETTAVATDQPAMRRPGLLTSLLAPKLDNIQLMPPSVENRIALAVVDAPFFDLTARLEPPALARFGTAQLVVEARREKFVDEQIDLAIENLPANVAATPQPIPKGQRSVAINIESKPNSPLGSFPIILSGVSTYNGRTVRVFAELVDLTIRPAVTVMVEPREVTLKQGEKGTVGVKLDRLPAYPGAIPLTVENLPPGVTVAAITIAEGASEATLEVSAAADAPITTVEQVIVRTKFKVGNQEETVDSPPIKLKVVAP